MCIVILEFIYENKAVNSQPSQWQYKLELKLELETELEPKLYKRVEFYTTALL